MMVEWSIWDSNLLCRQCDRFISFDSVIHREAGCNQPVETPEDPDQPEICYACLDGLKYRFGMEGINDVI